MQQDAKIQYYVDEVSIITCFYTSISFDDNGHNCQYRLLHSSKIKQVVR
jgi:hypothetical protein